MINNNKKALFSALTIFFLLISFQSFSQGYGVNKIVIDPGHGGHDPGAIGKHCKEKDIVLKVALKLGAYIEENFDDVEVIYTRKDDTFIVLNDRAKIANKAKADLFISIHANAVNNSAVFGAETFVMGTHVNEANLKLAQKENSVIEFEDNYQEEYKGFDPNSTESYLIFNFMQNAFREQSIDFATLVQQQYAKRVGRSDRQVKEAGFLVLAATTMPSVLTELGFVSNPKEEAFLISSQGQDYLASALFRAFRDYKVKMDAKQSLHLTAEEINVDEPIKSELATAVHSVDNGVVYKLQIFSLPNVLPSNHSSLAGLEDVDYYTSGGMYKYTIGNSSDIKDIEKLKKNKGDAFSGCFIIAFNNEKRITLSEAKALQKK